MEKAEFLEKYGDVTVHFSSYYKYTFTYDGEDSEGNAVYVYVGGDIDWIYKLHVGCDDKDHVEALDPQSGIVYNTEGKKVAEFYDY